MFSESPRFTRRTALKVGGFLLGGVFLPNYLSPTAAQAQEKPYVIALHGYNGTTEAGFIGGLKQFLKEREIAYETPLLPGGMNPDREEWEDIIKKRIIQSPQPPVIVAYSLSVIAALGVLSQEGVEIAKLRTVSGRKIRPALPIEFPSNLVDFYGGGVNIEQIKKNTSDRMVIHSRDDTVVWFDGNAPQLAEQLDARTYFVDGMGHFDQPASRGVIDRYSTRIALS